MDTRKRMLIGAVALATGLSAGCHGSGEDQTPTPVVQVQAATVAQGPIEQWIKVQAVLYPLHQAVITPKISAPVEKFLVNRGDHVRAGELLAVLENKDLAAAEAEARAQLDAARAAYQVATAGGVPADLTKARLDAQAAQQAYTFAQQVYDSRKSLLAQGAVSQHDLAQSQVDLANAREANDLAQQHLAAMEKSGSAQIQAHSDLAAAEAREQAAAAQLGYSQITSPIDGVVTDRPVYPGELATPSGPLMTVMDLSQIVAHAALPAHQAAQLKPGDTATLTPASGDPLQGRVTVVSPATDPGSTTVQVWAQADNPDGRLRPGTSVEVAMLAQTLSQAITVPAAAVLIDDSGAATVMVIGADKKAHQAAVTLGVTTADQDQVLTGLKSGQQVVTVGAFGLPDGSLIQIVTPKPAAADDKG